MGRDKHLQENRGGRRTGKQRESTPHRQEKPGRHENPRSPSSRYPAAGPSIMWDVRMMGHGWSHQVWDRG